MNNCPKGQRRTKRGSCVTPIDLKPGMLGQFGYKDVKKMTQLARHRALLKAIRSGEPPLGLFRRLNVLMIYFRYSDPKLSNIFKKDRDYIGSKILSKK